MTTGDGGASRRVSQGKMSTSAALPIRPSTATCAIHPVQRARSGASQVKPTAAIPAICTTVINGMAAKLTMRPAKVTREKTNAPIGSSAISAQADAIRSAAGGRSHGDAGSTIRELRHSHENAKRRAKRQREAGIGDLKRIGAEQDRRSQRSGIHG